MVRRILCVNALIVLLVSPAFGGANEIYCPKKYLENSFPISSRVGTLKEGATLTEVDVIEGHPGDETKKYPPVIAPDVDELKGSIVVWTYHFAPVDIKYGVMFICHYKNESGYLRYTLPTGITQCKARLKGRNNHYTVILARCR